ncbi:MAG TPA: hypothetical protein VJU53_04350 [Burkholderiaceae bacterium]|nr:hypothetical protein [Burkholderiaceae bacterium]
MGIIGFMNAAFGLRAVFFFAAFLAGALFTDFLATFLDDFLADDFLADFFPAFFAFFIAITFLLLGVGHSDRVLDSNCQRALSMRDAILSESE